jgi:hypothetical protein
MNQFAVLCFMDWQQVVSLCIVAATAMLFVVSRFRRRKFRPHRGIPCGCAAGNTGGDGVSIVFRARKGARPEIRVKLGRNDLPESLRSRGV